MYTGACYSKFTVVLPDLSPISAKHPSEPMTTVLNNLRTLGCVEGTDHEPLPSIQPGVCPTVKGDVTAAGNRGESRHATSDSVALTN